MTSAQESYQKCSNCHFYRAPRTSLSQMIRDSSLPTGGRCHRWPPQFGEKMPFSVFPPIESDDWCGEWMQKG